MTSESPTEAPEVTQAGCFPRIVTHEQALEAAKNFIDQHFNNHDGKGVLTGIPAAPEHDDIVLTDYIKQQRALARLTSASPMQSGLVEAQWFSPDAVPSVEKRSSAYFIVAVRRSHNGKIYSFPAQYLNEMELLFDDAEAADGVVPTSGWFSAETDSDEGINYLPLLGADDALVGWCDYPRWQDSALAEQSASQSPPAASSEGWCNYADCARSGAK